MTNVYSFRLIIPFILLFLNSLSVLATKKEPKWGKVTKEEIDLAKVDYDPEAHAVVLAETGKLRYLNQNFEVEIHRRIKILDKEGVEEGNIVLSYYSKEKRENINNVKAQTLEILENGEVVKHSLDRKQIFDVPVDENWSEVRFALPAVNPGTIIEYSYTLTTTNFTFLEGWVFQNDIPTLYSSYKVEIPHFLTYNTLMQGSRIYQKYYNERATNHWELENLPALKAEPYTYNLLDYAEKVQFQLHSYKTSDPVLGVSEKEVFVDWQAIADEVLKSRGFWSYSHIGKEAKDILSTVPYKGDSLQYAKQIYSFVQNNFKWNEYYGLFPDKDFKDFFKIQTGNSTSINLLMISLLKEAGYKAFPVYISTKKHGLVNPAHAVLSQFNQLIVLVRIGEKEYLVDAAGNQLAFGILPIQDLNRKGLLLAKNDVKWIDVEDQSKSYTLINYNADLRKGIHSYKCSWSGFEALQVIPYINKDRFDQILMLKGTEFVKDSVKIDNLLSTENSLKASLHFTEETKWEAQKIYFELPLANFLKENPFKNERRIFPVDFGHNTTNHFVYNIIIPENYTINEKPGDIYLKVPDGSATFIYQSTIIGNQLQVQMKFDIKKSFVPQQSYLHIRELFTKMISQSQQPYVFDKVN